MRSQIDAAKAKKDSGLSHYFETIIRSHKLTPAVIAVALSACATETVLLNSERIEHRFGSYGIEVLASEAGLRRSSLYSTEDGVQTCRTYAVVRFSAETDSSYGAEHAQVLAGNSLGEVFKENGWKIHKQTLHIGSLSLGTAESDVSKLMQLRKRRVLALHVYQLLLAKGEQIFEYATIAEAHHPDYLTESELLAIYRYDNSDSLSEESLSKLSNLITVNNAD